MIPPTPARMAPESLLGVASRTSQCVPPKKNRTQKIIQTIHESHWRKIGDSHMDFMASVPSKKDWDRVTRAGLEASAKEAVPRMQRTLLLSPQSPCSSESPQGGPRWEHGEHKKWTELAGVWGEKRLLGDTWVWVTEQMWPE